LRAARHHLAQRREATVDKFAFDPLLRAKAEQLRFFVELAARLVDERAVRPRDLLRKRGFACDGTRETREGRIGCRELTQDLKVEREARSRDRPDIRKEAFPTLRVFGEVEPADGIGQAVIRTCGSTGALKRFFFEPKCSLSDKIGP
jgi:hypothetical protein